MPWARSRSSWIVSFTSAASASSISDAVAGSSERRSFASRRFTASATRCCCAPSCKLRSILRRSASAVATMRAREARSSSAWRRTSSRLAWSAESSCMLCNASPTWRANSVSTRSSSSLNMSPSPGRSTTISPRSSPEWLMGAIRSCAPSRPATRAGSHTDAHAVPETPARATTVRSLAPTARVSTPRSGTETSRSSTSPPPVQTSAAVSAMVLRNDSTSCRSSSSIGMARVRRCPNVFSASSGARRSP